MSTSTREQVSQFKKDNPHWRPGVRVVSLKVSEKGCVSVYGLGRFPVTLYASQWTDLLANKEAILAFIEANRDKVAVKK